MMFKKKRERKKRERELVHFFNNRSDAEIAGYILVLEEMKRKETARMKWVSLSDFPSCYDVKKGGEVMSTRKDALKWLELLAEFKQEHVTIGELVNRQTDCMGYLAKEGYIKIHEQLLPHKSPYKKNIIQVMQITEKGRGLLNE